MSLLTSAAAECCEVRQDLQRLSEAHLVGEHAAEMVVAEETQPSDAVLLVGT